MENPILKLYSDLSDEELKTAIREMKEDEPNGIIRTDGLVRKLMKKVCEITGETNTSTHLFLVQNNLYREAAFRFVI